MEMIRLFGDVPAAAVRKPLPILSYPGVQKLGITVRELTRDGALMAECMATVARSADMLASVSFMDLSVEAECFGCGLIVGDYEVPTVSAPVVFSRAQAERLAVPQVGDARTGIYLEAVEKAKGLITDRPVLAGCIGPFSLTGRLAGVSETMIFCYEEPELVEALLDKSTEFITAYIKAFKKSGADGVILCEPLSGMVSPEHEAAFSAGYVKKIAEAVQDDGFIVVYHNCGNFTCKMTDSISGNGCGAFHFGNAVDLKTILDAFPANLPVLGNVSPSARFLNGTPDEMRAQTAALMERCGRYPNFIASSGCDIPPKAPWENIEAFFEAVKDYHTKRG